MLRYGGEAFSTEFGVDAYRKPPFLVRVALSEAQYLKGQKARVNVNARYYYGTPLAGRTVRCQVIRRARYDYSPVGMLPFFVDARAYLGRDGSNVRRETVMEKNGKLDDDGNFSFDIPLGDDIEDDYTYSVIALVADREAGLSGSAAFQVARSRFYLRSQAARSVFEPGARAEFEVQLVPYISSAAADIAGREVKATLYSRNFVFIAHEGQAQPLKTEPVRTDAHGRAKVSFAPADSGHYSVLFEAVDSAGQKTSLATAFWMAGRSDNIALPFKNINLVTDRDIYSVGDTAAVMLACPVPGRPVLVTVEGEKLYRHELLRPQGNTLVYSIKITPELSPNFTVAAIQFADGNIYRNEIKVVAPPHEKFIGVQLTPAKKEYRPGETAEIAVETRATGNKPVQAEVSLAVVDEAIYQIREDANPQIATFFYHPRRNNISTAFSAAYRFFGYAEERRLQLALERGVNPALAAIKEDDTRSRERFKDTTAWVAKVMTDANGRAVVRVPLEDNITTWRVTAVAVTPDTRVGQGRTEFVARKPLLLRAGLPQYMLGGEKQTIALTAQNLTAAHIEAKLEVSAEGVEVVDGAARMLVLAPGESVQVYSTLQAGPKAAQAVVRATLKAGDLADSESRTLPVRAPGIAGTSVSALTLRGNSTGALTFELPARFEKPQLNLRVSPGYASAVRQSLDYLVGYPWGCIEQTMSRFMPVLAAAKAGLVPEELKRELPAMVDRGLAHIRQNQRGDGGFGWFGEHVSDPMMTAWVLRGAGDLPAAWIRN